MMRSYVLRVAAEALADRRVVGHVEAVETGESTSIRSSDDLLEFLYRPGAGAAQEAADTGEG